MSDRKNRFVKRFLERFNKKNIYSNTGYVYKILNKNWDTNTDSDLIMSVSDIIKLTLKLFDIPLFNKKTLNLLLQDHNYQERAITLAERIGEADNKNIKFLKRLVKFQLKDIKINKDELIYSLLHPDLLVNLFDTIKITLLLFDIKEFDRNVLEELEKQKTDVDKVIILIKAFNGNYDKIIDFMTKLISFKLDNSLNRENIDMISDCIIFNNTSNSKIELIDYKKEYMKYTITIIGKYLKENNSIENKELLKNFFIHFFKKGSSYNPIGYNSKPGRIFQGLQIQWINSNTYSKFRNNKHDSNEHKFSYILENWEIACYIIKNPINNKVIIPLNKFLTISSNGNINDELNVLEETLKNILYGKNYIIRCFILYTYLYNNGISVSGYRLNSTNSRRLINFITPQRQDGTFLSPIYALYDLIKREKDLIEREIKKKEAIEKKIKKTEKKNNKNKKSSTKK